MANEFKIKNGLIVNEGGAEITGSLYTTGSGFFSDNLTVTGSLYANNITGSFFGTASYASRANFMDGGFY